MLETSEIQPDDLVWCTGWKKWKSARSIHTLFSPPALRTSYQRRVIRAATVALLLGLVGIAYGAIDYRSSIVSPRACCELLSASC
jgi:hypothetical protein